MRIALLMLGAGICFAQPTIQIQNGQIQNGPSTGGPLAANAATGQPTSGKIVTGRPFTAEAIVETDQTLADGSHVINQQTLSAARDSQGRTYGEEILGTPASGSSAAKVAYISDPVAKVNYFLGPDHIAHKTPMLSLAAQAGAATISTSGASARLSLQTFATSYGGGRGPVQIGDPSAQPARQLAPGAIDTKQLGSQVITGFLADGTRTTLTIPSGQVGNQNPLVIVTERWYSQELEAIVLAKHSDPRFGVSSYQLTKVQQIEPPATLFQIPSGYSIEEDGQ
jgi:hypothetical protein